MLTKKQLLKKLKVLRFQKFGSLRNAAAKLKITPQKLHKLERGETKFLDVYLLTDLAHAYGMTLSQLLELEEIGEL